MKVLTTCWAVVLQLAVAAVGLVTVDPYVTLPMVVGVQGLVSVVATQKLLLLLF